MDASKLKELREKHGRRVLPLEFTDAVLEEKFDLAVRPPTTAEFDRFVSKASDDKATELQRIARSCTVYPTGTELESLLGDYPGLYPKLAEMALELAGAASGALKKA